MTFSMLDMILGITGGTLFGMLIIASILLYYDR